jgi:CheY-like chemotaxis protein
MAKILVVDDEPNVARAMKLALETNGHEVVTAGSKEEAETAAVDSKPELMIVDVMMPEGTEGFHLVWKMRQMEDKSLRGVPASTPTRPTGPISLATTCPCRPGSTSRCRWTTCSRPSTESWGSSCGGSSAFVRPPPERRRAQGWTLLWHRTMPARPRPRRRPSGISPVN